MLPSCVQIRKLIESDEAVMGSICKIYAQDFICLGYRWPHLCDRILGRRWEGPAEA